MLLVRDLPFCITCFGEWRQREKLEVEKLVHAPAVGVEVRYSEAEEEMGFEILGQSNQTWEFTVCEWKWGEETMRCL